MADEKQLPAPAKKMELTAAPKQLSLQVNSYEEAVKVAKLARLAGQCNDDKSEAQVAWKVLAGQEMGLGAVASIQGLYIHEKSGQVGQKAELIKNAISQSGRYSYKTLECNDERCTLQFYVDGKPHPGKEQGVITWDRARAEMAGFFNEKNPNRHTWNKWGRNMYFKQCLMDGSRFFCESLFKGFDVIDEDSVDSFQETLHLSAEQCVAQAFADKRAEADEIVGEVIPTFSERQEAAALVAERSGDTAKAEAARELAYIDSDHISHIFKAGAGRWKIPQVTAWCKKTFGTSDDAPMRLNMDQYAQAKAHISQNKPE